VTQFSRCDTTGLSVLEFNFMLPRNLICLFAVCSLLCGVQGASANSKAEWNDSKYSKSAAGLLQDYIRVDTRNPPGNESRGVKFFAAILDAAGIEFESGESAPGRGNIWARIRGGDKPGLVLLHHMDVVPVNEKYWDVDAFAGLEKDGYIYGRGALDTKGLGILHLQAFLALHASGIVPNRDVWFVATADEEAGGIYGAGWLKEKHPEIFENAGFLLNEGGSGGQYQNDTVFMVEATQKVPLWLRLKALGEPGHGSRPQVETSVTRLLRAGNKIASAQFAPHVVGPVKDMFAGLAKYQDPEFSDAFADIEKYVDSPEFMLSLQHKLPGSNALLRNTCSVTTLVGSSKINVVPPEAVLELDCRLLPDQEPAEFLKELTELIDDSNIEIESIMSFTPAISSTNTLLFESLQSVLTRFYVGAKVIPAVSTGFTDSHFFRDMGIVSYGFAPFLLGEADARTVHGNNERVSIENMQRGTMIMIDVVDALIRD